MPNSIQLDVHGPDWPLGFINVVTPGTPVSIMSLVDPSAVNAPNAPQPPVAVGGVVTSPAGVYSYTVRAQQIIFQAMRPGAVNGTRVNTGNIYIVRRGVGTGTGNRDDYGAILMTLSPGGVWTLASAPMNVNVFSPYRYYVDADNAGDGVFPLLIIQ